MSTPHSFQEMTARQLRHYIDGCHRAQEYGSGFEMATRELNSRETAGPVRAIDSRIDGVVRRERTS